MISSSTATPSRTRTLRQGSSENASNTQAPERKTSALSQNDEKPLRPSQLLPQSPLLTHPYPHLAKKHKKRIATHKDLHALRQNPWAVALASPPRMCAITGTRLPRAFLGDWGMVRRPDSKEGLWFMPVGAMKDELELPSPHKPRAEKDTPRSESGMFRNRSFHYLVLRIVDRLPLLRSLTAALTGHAPGRKVSPIVRVLPFRWKHPHGPITAHEEKQMIWREDMPDFVLAQMRTSVVKQIKRVSDRYKRTNVANGVWTTMDMDGVSEARLLEGLKSLEPFARMETGAVIVLGSSQVREDAVAGAELETSSTAEDTLPEFIELPQTKSKVPLFDLRRLLSRGDLDEIRIYHPRFRSPAVFFRPDESMTIDAMLGLWKLQGLIRGDERPRTP
ncbi:hypothetical protein ATEIFO6365_0001085200 [Aspergillus terreus]|uniref:Uncharacterized protein n=1 Tax=Aspergillus terreus TaxID=33178 RepID=A0A5M3YQM2_ASPTE|nr:hypothetical protein ATETN484_0001077300 [Aspergillus terreus]GFF12629.1 hypothetical protein ATEIFO6365_0001085200 [Aspergillus terreus]